ncbi:MAG: hypothetical protein IKA55_08555 [Akkermansia sp.]|nr:hypothetical protein [Akkermansia sp.]
MSENPEIKIDVRADVDDAKRPMEELLKLMKANEATIAENDKMLTAAAESQERVQEVARGLISAVEELGDPTLKQYVAGLFAGGIENAAQMVKKVQELQRENQVLGRIQEGVLSRLNEQTIPGGGGVEEQTAGALHALGQFDDRFSASSRGAKGVAANVEGLGMAQDVLNLLQMLKQVNDELRNVYANAAAGRDDAQQRAAGLRDEAAALDEQLPGFEQKRAALLQEAAAYDRIAASQEVVRQGAQARLADVEKVVKLAGDGRLDEAGALAQRGQREATKLAGREQAVDNAQVQLDANKAAAAEKERAAAAERLAKERERAEAAAKKQRAEEELLNKEMEFSVMSRQQLAKELQRLTKERAAAAAVKDHVRYELLGRHIMAANRQMERMTRSLQMSKITGMQQVQMAQSVAAGVSQMGAEFANLGESVENGTVSLSGMSSAAIGLGMAIKTGMGPIGWAMLALEALVAAWNFFAQKRKADEERMREEARALAQAQHESRMEMEELWKKQAERSAESFADLYRLDREYYERERAEREQSMAERRRADEEAHRHRLAMLELELSGAKEKDRERIEAQIKGEKQAAERAALLYEQQRVDVAEAFADELETSLKQREERMGDLLTAWLPDIEAVNERARRLMADSRDVVKLSERERVSLDAQQQEARRQMQHILRLVRGVDKDFKGGAEDAVRWLAKMQETHRAQAELAESTRKQVVEGREGVRLLAKANENKRAELKRSEEIKEAQEEQKRAEKRLAEVLGRRVSRQYEPKERRAQDEVFAADERLLRRKLAAVDAEISRQRAEGADEGVLLQLRKRRREVQRQLVGLEEARVEETRRGIERMRRFEAQDMTAPTRRRDRRADELSERYAQMAVRAQAALDKGLKRRAEGYLAKMDRMAARIDRLTGDDQGSMMNREVQGALRLQLDAVRRTARAKQRTAAAAEREAAVAAGAQGAARQRNVAELEGAVRRLREENGRLARFLDGSAAAMRELVGVCRALQGQVNRALGELEVVRGQVRTLQASVRSVARK